MGWPGIGRNGFVRWILAVTSCYDAIVSNANVVLSERKEHDFNFIHLAPPSGAEVELSLY